MAISLPALPWEQNALEPHISANTISYHYGKHHNTYVTKLNAAIEGTALANESLESIVKKTAGDSTKTAVFNNAAQVWNHTFYWNSMSPKGGGEPTGLSASNIQSAWGDFAKFAGELKDAAAAQFGSGWAWLVLKDSKLQVVKTGNAETPLTWPGTVPLLTIDVWEHAYYLDYQNRRPDYVSTFVENLINWDFVNKNLG
jgi:Fe-Mn family superoxide dismutase